MTNRRKLEILESLPTDRNGDLILTPEACESWLPCQADDLPKAEAWAVEFDERFIGDYSIKTMPRRVLKEYFEGLKKYQLEFWKAHKDEIKVTLAAEILNEYIE